MTPAVAQPPTISHPIAVPQQHIHASYYPSWRIYRGASPSSLNIEITTHLFYAFAGVNEAGSLYHLDEEADLRMPVDDKMGCLAACLALKQRNPDLKVILSIGGGSGSDAFTTVAAAEATREEFARSAKAFVDMFAFDGIDIDWEHPQDPIQGRDYLLLLKTCRQHLAPPRYLVTSALPGGEWCLRNIDVKSASQILDWINLMCYDFSGPWTELSGHHAQLYAPEGPHNVHAQHSCDAAVNHLTSRGVSNDRICLGVPAYGRSFLDATGPAQKFTCHRGEAEGVFEYKDLPHPGTYENIDEDLVAAYCVGGDVGFLSYDVPATVAAKARYVKQIGLAGMFYWTGVGDAPSRSGRSLLSASWAVLND